MIKILWSGAPAGGWAGAGAGGDGLKSDARGFDLGGKCSFRKAKYLGWKDRIYLHDRDEARDSQGWSLDGQRSDSNVCTEEIPGPKTQRLAEATV